MNIEPLLAFIRKSETAKTDDKAYDVIWGGIRLRDRPRTPLTTLTIQDVLDWQDSIDARYMSEAAGAYQIMEDTLRRIVGKVSGTRLNEKFDKNTQDKLAICLLKGRGLDLYMSGGISDTEFANRLAREWASLPITSGAKKGRGFYDGDGLNQAHGNVEGFLAAVRALKDGPDTGVDPLPEGAWFKPIFEAILAFLFKITGGKKA